VILQRVFRLAPLILLLELALPLRAGAADIVWRSWNDGLREAQASGRPVLVDVYTDWCGWCKKMDRESYSRAEVRDFLGHRFVTVRLDAESPTQLRYRGEELSTRALVSHFRVTGYPTTIFLASNGEHVVTVPGYVPPGRFLVLLRYIGDGHYERGVSFQDFEKAQSSQR
jgi:thioredoxin-related protein